MAIVNRTLDATEQRKVYTRAMNTVATGTTWSICVVPWPCTLQAAQVSALGVSGAPTFELSVQRFIVGTGVTTWVLATGTSNLRGSFGTSGVGLSGMLMQGTSLLNLLPNDLISLTQAASNAATTETMVEVVLQPIQDIKYNFGLSV